MSKEKPPKEKPAEEGGTADTEGEGKKKPPLKLLIAGGVGALVVLGGGGVGLAMMLGGSKSPPAHKAHKAPPKEAKGKDAKGAVNPISEGPDGVVFYTMPDMIVNIQAQDGRPTFLKLKLAFEMPDEDSADALEPNQPRLNDMFQSFLRELRPEDLSGSQGSYELRQEIQRRVNLVIAPSKVNAVLIQEMLIQ